MLVCVCLQVGQTAEALNAARAEVESAEKEAMAVKKKADDLTAAAGRKSAEADNYRDKWEKMKEQVSVAKSAEREHWERAKQVNFLSIPSAGFSVHLLICQMMLQLSGSMYLFLITDQNRLGHWTGLVEHITLMNLQEGLE